MKKKYFFIILLLLNSLYNFGQVIGDFQSKINGNWDSASSWLTWNGAWVDASNYPGEITGSYSVVIQATHTITVSTNLSTASMGDLIVNGTLNLQGGSNPKQISLNTTLLYLTSTGILNFSTQKTQLYLPNNAVIKVDSGGNISGACSNNTEIYINNKLIAVCNGSSGNVLTFGEIVAGTGTLNANIMSPPDFTSTICNGTNISLTGGYTGTPNGAVTYLWTVKDPNNNAVSISNSTSTSTSFIPTLSGQYSISFSVTDGSSFSNTETKTITVQSLVTSGSISSAQAICSGTAPAALTSTDGNGDGTITYEWQTNASGSFVTIPAATAATYSPPTLTTTTSYQRRTVSTLNGVACYSAYTSPITITVGDTTLPTLTTGANQTANTDAGLCTASVVVTDAIFSDNCTNSTISYTLSGATTKTVTADQVGTYVFNKGVTTINYTVTDNTGNTITGSKTITVTDNSNPTLTVDANQTANTDLGLCTASVAVTDAVFTDNCSGANISYTLSGVTTKTTTAGQVGTYAFNKGITTISYTATDQTGNTTTGSKTVTVTDNNNPTLTAGATQTANTDLGLCTASVAVTDAAFSDNCTGSTISYTLSGVTTKTTTAGQVGTYVFNKGVTTINYTVTDAVGRTSTGSKTITVTDNTPPTLNVGIDQTANTNASCTASVAVTNATFSDNCTGSTISYSLSGATIKTTTLGQVGSYTFNKGVTTIDYTTTDVTGNTTTGSKTVTVTDNINPTLTAGTNQTANTDAGLCSASVAVTDANFSDNCTGSTISYSLSGATIKTTTLGQVGSYTFNKGVTTIDYTTTDATGNTTTGSKTVTVTDNINPTLTAGANQTANTDAGLCSASVAVTDANFSDNCTGSTISYTLSGVTIKAITSGQVGTYAFNKGVTTINYTVTDAVGRTAIGSKTITVTDNIPPTLTAGIDQTTNTTASCSASVAVTNATFSDNCTGSTISYTLSGATISAGTSGQVGTYTFNKGVTTINYTVTDAVGNITTGSKTVTVNDNVNPTLTAGANQTANTAIGSCSASVAVANAVFSDNCTGSTISYTLSGATVTAVTSGQVGTYTFNKGITTINYTVTDAVGNTIISSKTITITDNSNPTLTAGANQTANTDVGLCTASVAVTDAAFSDNCTGSTVSYTLSGVTTKTTTSGQVGTYIFNKGVTTINYTVTDAVGNIITGSKTVTIADNIPPTLTVGIDQAANTTASCTASVVVTTATFSDNCTGATISYTLSGVTTKTTTAGQVGTYTFNKGVTTINYTVTDAVGNISTGSKTVTVNDNIDPVVIATSDVITTTSIDGTGNCSAAITIINALPNDNCSVAKLTWSMTGATIANSLPTGTNQVGTKTFNKGTTSITYTITDSSGRTATDIMTVIVNDNEKPTAPSLANITAQCSITVPYPTTTDNCDGTVTATTGDPITYNTQGTYVIHWSFKDSSGNETFANQNIIIKDITAPVPIISNLSALTFSSCQIDNLIPPTATDNCTGSINGTPNITFPYTTQGTKMITWTYNDGNGNITTQTQNLTLTAPAISGGTLSGYINNINPLPTATDNIAITSCPDDLNPITINLSGQIGTIIQWEKFEAGSIAWGIIPNTAPTYNTVFNFQNTKSTLFRVLVQVGNCTEYSNMVNIHAIPPDVPPILEQNNFVICLNAPITLIAHNGYNSASVADDGGDFNTGQFPNKWDPTQWKIDGKTAGAQWTAAGNNTKFNNWSGTNNHPVGTNYKIEYNSNNLKFGIAHGNYNSAAYIAAFPPGNPTTLETPIFSLVGLKTASVDFDQAYNLHAGDIAKLELSLDGGLTYTIVLQDLIGTSPHALAWGDTHGAPVPYPYQAPKSNNSTTTYFNFQNDNSSFDISDYIGNDNVRVKWTFFGTTDESAWAIDNITIPVKPYSDQLEWTDGIGEPNIPPLASGTIDVAYTFTPSSPGIHQYGATSLINGCRAYDPSGTAIATVKVNYSYAGLDVSSVAGKCGGTTATLNAYDNTKTASENKTNGAYPGVLDAYSNNPGTGQTGTWSIASSTGGCGLGSFSNVNDPKATFTGTAGTYTLRWTVAGCTDDVQVTLENCNVVDFDGEDDHVNFSNNYNLTSPFTISVWIKPETQPASGTSIQAIFSKRNGDNLSAANGYDLRLDNNNYISFNWNNGGTLKSTNPINTSRWYHIGVTYDGATYKLYIDGIEIASASGSAPATNNLNCILGAMNRNGNPNEPINYYSGWMQELQIWNIALSPDQLHQMMNQEINSNGTQVRGVIIPIDVNGLTWSNLKGYYRMNDISCGYLKPFGGVGVDGRLKNITTTQSKTAPLPYVTIRDGNWKDRSLSSTPWLYGSTVWDYPNSTGINGQQIDWNIVVASHNLNSDDKDITLLGLITNTNTKLKVVAPGVQDEKNSGHMLWLTHYLKLDGFIDLIGESQLLQKRYYPYPQQYNESIFDEASSGYIERDQQGQKNSFNYNYWTSPVSVRGGANNSPYTISSILKDGTDSANPKTITFGDGVGFADGALSSPIKISNRWILTYNATTPVSNSEWDNFYQWKLVGSASIIKTGDGFSMKGTGGTAAIDAKQNYVFVGKPNSGDIKTSFLTVDQTYLIGNPYPSALDADEFIKNNLNGCSGCTGSISTFNGILYFWDHFGLSNNHILAQYEGGYATYSLLGGTPAIDDSILTSGTSNPGSRTPGRYIPVGQAFFVDATPDPSTPGSIASATTPGYINFKNSQRAFAREALGSSLFMKTAGTKEENATQDKRLKIRLGFNSPIGTHRQLLLGADSNTTNQFDIGYDAPMIDLNKNDMYWDLNNRPLVIQAIPNLNNDQIIPLGITVAKEGVSTIKIDALENIPNTLEIYLYDNQTKIYHNIRDKAFSISLPIGEYNKRFSLEFMDKTHRVDEVIPDEGIIIFYTNTNKMLNIQNNLIDTKVTKAYLFNLLGQNLGNWEIKNNKQNNIQIPIKNISSAVYIVKIITEKGEFSKKIIIH
ncbi:LamG-like jellyroll fold domain-containing protein [Flavobacterium sp. W1B]|uniref:LamG-like jellyroll fold domain-containing protein n=1 Tax=Flavobacterium sp. W1B TaxID=3394146 RepID=UPI0039BCFFE2